MPRNLAVHEAGHAVAAVRLRLWLRYTMLEAKLPHNGSTAYSPRRKGSPSRDQREAVAVYAGCEAERHSVGTADDHLLLSCLSDFNQAEAIGRRHVPDELIQTWVDERREEARALVLAD